MSYNEVEDKNINTRKVCKLCCTGTNNELLQRGGVFNVGIQGPKGYDDIRRKSDGIPFDRRG